MIITRKVLFLYLHASNSFDISDMVILLVFIEDTVRIEMIRDKLYEGLGSS